jgi:hypothetical protein
VRLQNWPRYCVASFGISMFLRVVQEVEVTKSCLPARNLDGVRATSMIWNCHPPVNSLRLYCMRFRSAPDRSVPRLRFRIASPL